MGRTMMMAVALGMLASALPGAAAQAHGYGVRDGALHAVFDSRNDREAFFRWAYRNFDANRDGRLGEREMTMARRSALTLADRNGNGRVSEKEWDRFVRSSAYHRHPAYAWHDRRDHRDRDRHDRGQHDRGQHDRDWRDDNRWWRDR